VPVVGGRSAHRRSARAIGAPLAHWAACFALPACAVALLGLVGVLTPHDQLEGLPTARVMRGDVSITIDEPGVVAGPGLRVETQVGATDLARVRPGGRALIHLRTAPGAAIEARVASVAQAAREKVSRITGQPTGIEVFDVVVEPLARDARLHAGLAASVEILVSEHHGVLYVPVAAVFLDELERPTVYVRTGRWAEAREVELLVKSDRYAVLSAGVKEGDEILIELPPVQ
jgi:hypothetical protein